MPHTFPLVLVSLLLALPSTASLVAQAPTTTLVGTVLDSGSASPVAEVALYLDSSTLPQWTDSTGWFQLGDLERTPHVLVLLKRGYAPKRFRFDLSQHRAGEIDVGAVFLTRGHEPTASVSGVISDSITGFPVFLADVRVNGEQVAVTGVDGGFAIPDVPLNWGVNELEFRRIGYNPRGIRIWTETERSAFNAEVEMVPLAVQLSDVVVEGERTVYVFGRLREFEQRRRSALGHYLTQNDVEERRPYLTTDMLRRVPGVRVSPTSTGGNSVRITRRGWRCSPVYLLDGVPLNTVIVTSYGTEAYDVNIDDLVSPDEVAGIEVYKGPATIPAEFGMLGTDCGVIAIWTK